MSVQAQITGDLKVRELDGGLYAEGGIVTSKPFGAANGFATLGGDGKVPSSQLPSYVDDVVEVANYAALPIPGEVGKIYVTLDTNYIYRWTGSTYVEIADSTAVWGAITGTLSNQIDLQNALNAKVPYTGATGNVNLGEYGITSGFVGFDLTPTATPTGIGTMYWDAFYRTASLIDGDGDTTLQIGQEQRALIHNNTGATLTDGQVVYVTGSTGNLPSVALASNATEASSSVTFGVVTESIANGADGFVTISGNVSGLNTLAFNEGDALYLGATAGTFTNVKPTAPANLVLIGYMIKKAGGNGIIFVKIQNGYELEELHDVSITSVANNDGLFWDSATSLWKNKTIAGVLGYTPADDSLVVHLAGVETITGGKFFNAFAQFNANVTHNAATLNYANNVFFHSATLSNYSGATSMVGVTNGLKFGLPSGATSQFNLPSIVGVVYTFPSGPTSSGGTLALTTDLGAYLPLTGGTLTGKLTINTGGADNQLQLNGTAPSLRLTNAVTGATINGFIAMAGTAGDYILTSAVGDMCIGNQNSGKIMFGFGSGTANPKMIIDASGNGVFSGTISATGGTLTGALSGTSATFSGALTLSALTTGYLTKVGASGVITFSKLYENSFGGIQINNTETNGAQYYTTRLGPRGNNDGVSSTWYIPSNAAPTIGWGTAATSSAFTISTLADDITRLYVGSTGNVGIGTSSPEGILEARAGVGANFRVRNNGSNILLIQNYNDADAYRAMQFAASDIIFNTGAAGGTDSTERMRITSGGSVCMGRTSAPSSAYRLAVQDAVMMAVSTNGNNMINFFNQSDSYVASIVVNASSVAYNTSSDYRLKQDLKDFNGLDLVSAIKTYDYEWKSDQSRAFGVIAHELAEVIPYAVTGEKDGEQIQGVDYSKLVPILIKAIQEQQEMINELKALIAAK